MGNNICAKPPPTFVFAVIEPFKLILVIRTSQISVTLHPFSCALSEMVSNYTDVTAAALYKSRLPVDDFVTAVSAAFYGMKADMDDGTITEYLTPAQFLNCLVRDTFSIEV